ncbi:hypothetical protein ACOME3_005139 [Neoechinorhynchus agilis]
MRQVPSGSQLEDECSDQEVHEALTPSRRMLKETFDSADINKDGYVSQKEMLKFLKERGVKIPRTKSLISKFRPRKLTFEQFCSEIESKSIRMPPSTVEDKKKRQPVNRTRSQINKIEHYKEIFSYLDANGDGTVTAKEMRDRMAQTGTLLSDEQIDKMIDMADTNNDRLIDFDEFVKLMNRLTIQRKKSRESCRSSIEEPVQTLLGLQSTNSKTIETVDDTDKIEKMSRMPLEVDSGEVNDQNSSYVETDCSQL